MEKDIKPEESGIFDQVKSYFVSDKLTELRSIESKIKNLSKDKNKLDRNIKRTKETMSKFTQSLKGRISKSSHENKSIANTIERKRKQLEKINKQFSAVQTRYKYGAYVHSFREKRLKDIKQFVEKNQKKAAESPEFREELKKLIANSLDRLNLSLDLEPLTKEPLDPEKLRVILMKYVTAKLK